MLKCHAQNTDVMLPIQKCSYVYTKAETFIHVPETFIHVAIQNLLVYTELWIIAGQQTANYQSIYQLQ